MNELQMYYTIFHLFLHPIHPIVLHWIIYNKKLQTDEQYIFIEFELLNKYVSKCLDDCFSRCKVKVKNMAGKNGSDVAIR